METCMESNCANCPLYSGKCRVSACFTNEHLDPSYYLPTSCTWSLLSIYTKAIFFNLTSAAFTFLVEIKVLGASCSIPSYTYYCRRVKFSLITVSNPVYWIVVLFHQSVSAIGSHCSSDPVNLLRLFTRSDLYILSSCSRPCSRAPRMHYRLLFR